MKEYKMGSNIPTAVLTVGGMEGVLYSWLWKDTLVESVCLTPHRHTHTHTSCSRPGLTFPECVITPICTPLLCMSTSDTRALVH